MLCEDSLALLPLQRGSRYIYTTHRGEGRCSTVLCEKRERAAVAQRSISHRLQGLEKSYIDTGMRHQVRCLGVGKQRVLGVMDLL